MKTYETYREAALDAIAAEDPRAAFLAFRSVLEYPGKMAEASRWADALGVFAQIGDALAGSEFASKVRAVASDPDDVQALYDLGYELIEQSLPGVAATVLARANEIAPHQEEILTELVCALENDGRYHEACWFLRQSPEVVNDSFMCRYLLAFNALMTGDLSEPRQLMPSLLSSEDPDHVYMADQIEGMLCRAAALEGVTALDARDLRGWDFVLNGSVLLHFSPFGLDEGMNGRYAFTQDSHSRCLEGIRRLEQVLQAWEARPPRVFLLPDRNSAALGLAAARVLGIPVEPWPAQGTTQPGLIVSYDLKDVDKELRRMMLEHHTGQMLWAHCQCWIREAPFSPDFVTYLYQFNTSPWEPRLVIDPATHEAIQMPAMEGTPEELAQRVVDAALQPEALEDLPLLLALARAARAIPGKHGPAALLQGGRRRRHWADSPVPSNRFA